MNESRLQELLEGFQNDVLSEEECRELIEWFDEDELRVSAFADSQFIGKR